MDYSRIYIPRGLYNCYNRRSAKTLILYFLQVIQYKYTNIQVPMDHKMTDHEDKIFLHFIKKNGKISPKSSFLCV